MRTTRWLAGAFVVALALRLAHVLPNAAWLTGDVEVGMDRWVSRHVAEAVADGRWLGGWSAAYDSSPGYSYVLAALYRLTGRSWLAVLVVQAMLGACVPLALWAVGRRLFDRRVGGLAAALAASFAPALFYEALLVKFALVPVTVALLLWGLVTARAGAAPGVAFTAGLPLGALAVLRPNAALLAPALALWLAWPFRRSRPARGIALAAALAAGASTVLLPMAVRDHVAARSGLDGSLWGIHFYIGNHPSADGEYVSVPGVREDIVGHVVDARRVAETAAGRPLAPREVSAWWFARGLAFLRAEPARAVALYARKVRMTFAGDELGSFGDEYHDHRAASLVLRLPLVDFAVVGPLGLLGLAIALVRRRGRLLALVVAGYTLSLLPFFVAGRYRLPIAPPMIVLAALALAWLEERLRRREATALALAGAFLVAAGLGLGADGRQWLLLAVTLVLGIAGAAWLDDARVPSVDHVPERA